LVLALDAGAMHGSWVTRFACVASMDMPTAGKMERLLTCDGSSVCPSYGTE
jgi:hypothetical protein